MRIFGKPLSDIAIVDNSLYAFAFQIENGIPIVNYYHGEDDNELSHLSDYIEYHLRDCTDVRLENRAAFGLKEMSKDIG